MAAGAAYVRLVPPPGSPELEGGCVEVRYGAAGEGGPRRIGSGRGYGIAVDPNPWNTESGSGDVAVKACPYGFEAVAKYSSATARSPQETVLGYPEVIYGYKPWGRLSTPAHPALRLPARVGDLPPAAALVDYSVEFPDGRGNMAFDLWITASYMPDRAAPGDVELMIWLYREGMTPMGYERPTATVTLPAIINGAASEVNWGVYVAHPMGPGKWTYVAFTLEPPVASGRVLVPLTALLRSASSTLEGLLGRRLEDMYLNGVELGMEYTSRRWPPVGAPVEARYVLRELGLLVL